MSPEALVTTETVKLPPVTLVRWRPWLAEPVTAPEILRLTVPPLVRATLIPAPFDPEPVTAPLTFIVSVTELFVFFV